ncbi:MAG: hypothetical protein KDA84_22185 [Planctomycetaceae bacterium]|nr:hypothetical protein [Planctomycetaceae bacterium]
MLGKTASKPGRVRWIILHGALLGCGLWLLMLVEERSDRRPQLAIRSEQSHVDTRDTRETDPFDNHAEINKRIERLRDPIHGVRLKATRQLMAFGSQAVRPLAGALSNHDPNVRRQAQLILTRLIGSDDSCFAELEEVACSPNHPSSQAASAILQRECSRRVDVETAMIEQQKASALRFLRNAKDALSRGQFLKARQLVFAAEALDVSFQPTDDQPAVVLEAIDRAEKRAALPLAQR